MHLFNQSEDGFRIYVCGNFVLNVNVLNILEFMFGLYFGYGIKFVFLVYN
jgi:hypothetical protein